MTNVIFVKKKTLIKRVINVSEKDLFVTICNINQDKIISYYFLV